MYKSVKLKERNRKMKYFNKLFKKINLHKNLKNIYIKNNYNKIPALPKEESEINKILTNYKSMPMLVPKEYMTYIDDVKLVFGHIVMLWWIDNHYKKEIPQYFIYQYGLDFETELKHLKKLNLIDNKNALTKRGLIILDDNKDIIRKHKAKKSIHLNGHIEYHFSDKLVTENIQHFVSSGDFLEDQKMGASFEKNKDYINAIKAYLAAIENSKVTELGEIPPNPFMRLAIIYRKLKNKDKEVAILKEGI